MSADDLEIQLLEDLAGACEAVLGQPGGLEPGDDTATDSLVAVVGFSGRHIRGAVGIRLSLAVASETHPLGAAAQTLPELADWAAEISNQLLGGIKARLAPRGYDVWCATPVVLRGVRLDFVGETVARHLSFNTGSATAWVQVAWSEQPETTGDDVMMPGEMMMF